MDQIESGDQIILYDPEKTRKAYSTMETGDAERCGCSYCRNFAAQRSTVYPDNFRRLLAQLGIDPEKEGEVFEYNPEGILRAYGGWFYFAGELIEPGEPSTDSRCGFQYHFADAKRLPAPSADFGQSVAAIEFYAKLPWVISEQP